MYLKLLYKYQWMINNLGHVQLGSQIFLKKVPDEY